ncbi:mCG1038921 [Mus musculus]|nr:mCG1038921 [Mus musculus]
MLRLCLVWKDSHLPDFGSRCRNLSNFSSTMSAWTMPCFPP